MAEELTHAGLYDLLHIYFGIGDYDDLVSERLGSEPWYRCRMTEIGKLKRLMKSRHVDIADMVQAAEYAHSRHLCITASWQVCELVGEARRAAREAERLPLSQRLQDAASQALAVGEDAWAARLAGASSVDALNAWEASRG